MASLLRKLTFRFYDKGTNFSLSARVRDLGTVQKVYLGSKYSSFLRLLNLDAESVVLDVGAHIGLFALSAFRDFPGLKIFSIEASPSTFTVLEKNLKNNNLPGWKCFRFAISDGRKTLKFFEDTRTSSKSRIDLKGNVSVPAIRLGDFIENNQLGDIGLIKMDIEGAESDVFSDPKMKFETVRYIIFQIHPMLCDSKKVIESAKEHYKYIYNLDSHPERPLLLATNTRISSLKEFAD